MRVVWVLGAIVAGGFAACGTSQQTAAPPTFREDIAPLFAEKCSSCHSGDAPKGGYRTTSYIDAIGCGASGTPATAAQDAPILRALDRADHAGVLDASQRDLVSKWIAAGAPAFHGAVHDPTFVDPRSNGSHDKFLRARSWKPMLDANDPDACGRCHEGAPVRPNPTLAAAPGATSCTNCHDGAKGPLECTTCHGSAGKAHPPRDACLHPDAKADTSHAGHERFTCSTCHPAPNAATPIVSGGPHGDGHVEVWFDPKLAGNGARFDGAACSVWCHSGPQAKRPKPAWNEQKMVCGDCHAAPPAGHYAGACSNCHREANADGTSIGNVLHVNGKVDLGDGSGKCGACHGTGDDPWPTTGAHARHKAPLGAQPVACTTCHELPSGKHPLGGRPIVKLTGLASNGGLAPTYDASTQTCANVYCHAVRGGAVPTPSWSSGPSAAACGSCHSIPPTAPHPNNPSCGTTNCHASAVSSGALTDVGKKQHVNGVIELK